MGLKLQVSTRIVNMNSVMTVGSPGGGGGGSSSPCCSLSQSLNSAHNLFTPPNSPPCPPHTHIDTHRHTFQLNQQLHRCSAAQETCLCHVDCCCFLYVHTRSRASNTCARSLSQDMALMISCLISRTRQLQTS